MLVFRFQRDLNELLDVYKTKDSPTEKLLLNDFIIKVLSIQFYFIFYSLLLN